MANGIEDGAIFLMALGENEAAEVLKHLEPKEVQKLSAAMMSLKNLGREQIESVVKDFVMSAGGKTTIGMDSGGYIRNMLTKAIGDDKAAGLLDQYASNIADTSGIEGLKWMDPGVVAEMIQNEHPQIIATILVHLDPDQAAGVLKMLTSRTRNDTLLRISTLDGAQPIALRDLNEVLSKLMLGGGGKKTLRGGVAAAADILNFMGGALETEVMDSVRSYDPDLAQKIEDKMFIFENILEIEDRGIQVILREVQSEALIVALKGASEELREKIFKNMSQRAGEMMREDLESKGPVKLSDVEANQKEILKVVRRLSDEGQVTIGGRGDDAYV